MPSVAEPAPNVLYFLQICDVDAYEFLHAWRAQVVPLLQLFAHDVPLHSSNAELSPIRLSPRSRRECSPVSPRFFRSWCLSSFFAFRNQYVRQSAGLIRRWKTIQIRGIPLVAWDYGVNGKAGLGDGHRQRSQQLGYRNHGHPKHPLELFLRMVAVSLETKRSSRHCLPSSDAVIVDHGGLRNVLEAYFDSPL